MKKLIVGLGNPGDKYSKTRHNIGFMAIKKILGLAIKFKEKNNNLYYEENNTIFLLPQTYMNRSGSAVQTLATFYKIPPKDIIVIHDDLDLALGQIKVKFGGGAGGHNGLKSIDETLGKNYLRIRLGIGRPQNKEEVSNFVLNNFARDEELLLNKMLDFLVEEIEQLLVEEVTDTIIGKFLHCYKSFNPQV
jgi:PTH1 family peptidyl-tRNA hydrolase